MKPSDQYLKIVQWSEEDNCYIGRSPGLMLGGVHGDNEAEVYRDLCLAVEEVIALHEEDGIPLPKPTSTKSYSGKFLLRVGEDLHEKLAVNAILEGNSLNSHCTKILEREAV